MNRRKMIVQLNKNCTLTVPEIGNDCLLVNCVPNEQSNVFLDTLSPYRRTENIISFPWRRIPNVNWLALHSTKPLISYVIDETLKKNLDQGKSHVSPYALRLMNISLRGPRLLARLPFHHLLVDMKFSSDSNDRLAVIDQIGTILIYKFSLLEEKLSVELHISSTLTSPVRYLSLNWCPLEDEGLSFRDCKMVLVASVDNYAELFDLKHFPPGMRESTLKVDRKELNNHGIKYKVFDFEDKPALKSAVGSFDGTTICGFNVVGGMMFLNLERVSPHKWYPYLETGDNISAFFFIEDESQVNDECYDFWGHVLIGTEKGSIRIFQLDKWESIQELQINVVGDPEAKFEYRIDSSWKHVAAVCGLTGFLIFLDFFDGDEFDKEDGKIKRHPRIVKVNRFPLYSPIISFDVRRQSPDEIAIIWINTRSIEKCTFSVPEMEANEESQPNNFQSGDFTNILSYNNEPTSSTGTAENSLPFFLNVLPKKEASEDDNEDKGISRIMPTPSSIPPQSDSLKSLNLDYVENNRDKNSNSLLNSLMSMRNDSLANNEVARIFNMNESQSGDKSGNDDKSPTMSGEEGIGGEDQRRYEFQMPKPIHLGLAPDPQSLSNYELEAAISSCKSNILATLRDESHLLRNSVANIAKDLATLRADIKDPNVYKGHNKMIDTMLRKLMDQINDSLSKGLDEFLCHVHVEVNNSVEVLNQTRNEMKQLMVESVKQRKEQETQNLELLKAFRECMNQQQRMMQQMSTIQQQIQSQRTVTRTPSEQSNDLARIKAAEYQRIRMKIAHDSDNLVKEGIIEALNMAEPAFIDEILQYLLKKKTIDGIVDIIGDRQALIVSLMSTFALSNLSNQTWKIDLLSRIMPMLDVSQPLVEASLPSFLDKLKDKLEEAKRKGGSSQIPLLLKMLQLYQRK